MPASFRTTPPPIFGPVCVRVCEGRSDKASSFSTVAEFLDFFDWRSSDIEKIHFRLKFLLELRCYSCIKELKFHLLNHKLRFWILTSPKFKSWSAMSITKYEVGNHNSNTATLLTRFKQFDTP